MRFVPVVFVLLAACVPEGGPISTSAPAKGDWSGLSFIKSSSRDSETAGRYYFDCLTLQAAVQMQMVKLRPGTSTKAQRVERAIESCRPTGRHYATILLSETVDFDRRFYAENVRKFVLPDIEAVAKKQLSEVIK